jgi:cytochrome P450
LTPVELAGMFVQLMVAGHETTAHLVGRGIYELMRAPDQWASLCRDPAGLAANTAEELLRVVSPLQWQTRVPLQGTTVAGTEILAGTTVHTVIAAANRDAEVFPDPDDLDIRRENARAHLAFGAGPHFCLGASLARMEGEIAFRSLAQRFPGMEAVDGSATWSGKPELPALSRLTVTV